MLVCRCGERLFVHGSCFLGNPHMFYSCGHGRQVICVGIRATVSAEGSVVSYPCWTLGVLGHRPGNALGPLVRVLQERMQHKSLQNQPKGRSRRGTQMSSDLDQITCRAEVSSARVSRGPSRHTCTYPSGIAGKDDQCVQMRGGARSRQ